MWLGSNYLSFFWKVMRHCSPIPASIAGLSSQSMSTPSKKFDITNSASFFAHYFASTLAVVGNSVAPKALIRILIPASLYLFRRFVWMFSFVAPKTELPPKYFTGSAQIKPVSQGPLEKVQKARAK